MTTNLVRLEDVERIVRDCFKMYRMSGFIEAALCDKLRALPPAGESATPSGAIGRVLDHAGFSTPLCPVDDGDMADIAAARLELSTLRTKADRFDRAIEQNAALRSKAAERDSVVAVLRRIVSARKKCCDASRAGTVLALGEARIEFEDAFREARGALSHGGQYRGEERC